MVILDPGQPVRIVLGMQRLDQLAENAKDQNIPLRKHGRFYSGNLIHLSGKGRHNLLKNITCDRDPARIKIGDAAQMPPVPIL
jgi:hypothetical protein